MSADLEGNWIINLYAIVAECGVPQSMLRIQMMASMDHEPAVFDWFVHFVGDRWFITVNDPNDLIFSVPADVCANPLVHSARVAAQLWPTVWTIRELCDLRGRAPNFLRAEIRVMSLSKTFWLHASTWIWQGEQALACRSYPAIRSKTKPVPVGPLQAMAQACFDIAAELEEESTN